MRPRTSAVSILAGLLLTGCGNTAVDPLTGPGAPSQLPNLVGHWTGGGSVNYVSSLTGTNFGFLCERTMDVTAQDGGELSGSTSWKGGGVTSDAHCSHLGAFLGTVALDGTVTLRMSQPVEARDCKRLAGDDVFNGLVRSDSRRMEGRMTDRVSCVDLSGQTFEADRTVTFSVTRIGT